MADKPIGDVPDESSPDLTDQLLAWNSSSAASLISIQQIYTIIKTLIVANATTAFDTLEELEDGKLSIDGSLAMTGDLDLGSNTLSNIGALGENLAMGGNYITGLGFPGILVKSPTVITATDTSWDFDSYTRYAFVTLIGGGGGTDGINTSTSSNAEAAVGAGAGGWVFGIINVGSLTNKWANITIGAGGTGGTAAPTNGTDGGNSTWVDDINTLTANGGARGLAAGEFTAIKGNRGSLGGTASGGLLNVSGNAGQPCLFVGSTIQSTLYAQGGAGGNSLYGVGGRGGRIAGSSSTGDAGEAAIGYGAGAGGPAGIAGGGGNGGAGGDGVCIVWEYM